MKHPINSAADLGSVIRAVRKSTPVRHDDLAGAVRHRNRLAFERLQLTIYSNEPGKDEGQYFGICNRVRGDRALLSATVWLPLPELMQLAPDLVAGRFVELELRVKGFFRSRGSVPGITFNTRATPDDELPAD